MVSPYYWREIVFSCILFLKTDSLQIEQSTVVKLTFGSIFYEVNFTAEKIYIFLELKSNTWVVVAL